MTLDRIIILLVVLSVSFVRCFCRFFLFHFFAFIWDLTVCLKRTWPCDCPILRFPSVGITGMCHTPRKDGTEEKEWPNWTGASSARLSSRCALKGLSVIRQHFANVSVCFPSWANLVLQIPVPKEVFRWPSPWKWAVASLADWYMWPGTQSALPHFQEKAVKFYFCLRLPPKN